MKELTTPLRGKRENEEAEYCHLENEKSKDLHR